MRDLLYTEALILGFFYFGADLKNFAATFYVEDGKIIFIKFWLGNYTQFLYEGNNGFKWVNLTYKTSQLKIKLKLYHIFISACSAMHSSWVPLDPACPPPPPFLKSCFPSTLFCSTLFYGILDSSTYPHATPYSPNPTNQPSLVQISTGQFYQFNCHFVKGKVISKCKNDKPWKT